MQELLKKTCWIITEGIAGTENQCIGVAHALGLAPIVKRISLRQPWKSLSPYLAFETPFTFTPALRAPWPDILIASGRKSIAASRYIKRKSGGKTFTVQIQDPRINPKHFDLVAVPEHDPTRGQNVIVTKAAPNLITNEKLALAKAQFHHFENFPAPRVAVLIGGSSQAYEMTPHNTRTLIKKLEGINASLMITASRRTGKDNEAILKKALSDHYFWNGQGDNPYLGFLAHADFILVTADSTSMISEACSTGKPVYMIELNPRSKKHVKRIDKMHENLKQSGCLKVFEGNLEIFQYDPLNDAALIATEIRKRMNL